MSEELYTIKSFNDFLNLCVLAKQQNRYIHWQSTTCKTNEKLKFIVAGQTCILGSSLVRPFNNAEEANQFGLRYGVAIVGTCSGVCYMITDISNEGVAFGTNKVDWSRLKSTFSLKNPINGSVVLGCADKGYIDHLDRWISVLQYGQPWFNDCPLRLEGGFNFTTVTQVTSKPKSLIEKWRDNRGVIKEIGKSWIAHVTMIVFYFHDGRVKTLNQMQKSFFWADGSEIKE